MSRLSSVAVRNLALTRSHLKQFRYPLLMGIAVMLVWATAELVHRPISVEAEETQAPQPATPLASPWAGASFPVEGFQAYTSPFGYRQHPTLGTRRFHYGLDVAAPMGSYIRNWWDGTVVRVSDNTSCGTSVIVESGDWTHIYCHMQGHVVWEQDGDRVMVDRAGGLEIVQGQTVKAGTRIGRVGVTGRTTGPHLHWGMKYQGSWIDPALVLKAMYATQSE
ncbi:MAG: M23 family metallopeptidase [Cyanobacteria bacterium P01_A01_bin.123]